MSKKTCQNDVIDAFNDLTMAQTELAKKRKRFDEVSKECTHQYGDGKTALVSGYFDTSCAICGWSDYGPSC